MRRLWLLSQFAAASFLVCSSALTAQNSAIAPRILGPIEESSLTTLTGSVPLLARAEYDLGAAPASTQLTHVRLVLSRSGEQEAALGKFMAEQQDKSSPNYHKWVTPEQFGMLYGPADSDIAAIVGWLESKGLKVETVSTGRTNIAFSGTVSQVEEAFQTAIHSFQVDGEGFVSNVAEPKIPTALAPVVAGVAHLNTIKPKPHHVQGKSGRFDPSLGRFVPEKFMAANGARSQYTTGTGTPTDPYNLYLVAADAATIYNTPNSLNANFGTGTSYTGKGVTIGIGGDALIQASTVMEYQNRFIGTASGVTITNVDGVTANGDTDEGYIDTEIASGLAPGAEIHFYTANLIDTAIDRAINDNLIDIFSLSFGVCEQGMTTATNALVNGWWQQAATQGIAVTVSTGDSGSAACNDPNTDFYANSGLMVNGLASTPYNVAVGGTDLSGLLGSFTTYVNTTSSSATFFRTATSYIPESTWNNSPVDNFSLNANVPYFDSNNNPNIVAGGGGASSCSVNSDTTAVCSSGYKKPSWQRGIGVPADAVRDLPDVSFMSGNGVDASAWLVCTDEPVTGTAASHNCAAQPDSSFNFSSFGGTSTATPAFAGMLALVQEKMGARLGQATKELYDLYNGPQKSAIFQDVTQGNNSVICKAKTQGCQYNGARWYFLVGYDAKPGYDLATGLGSVNASQMVNFWSSATGTGASTVTVTPSSTSATTDQSLTVAISVTGSLGIPTGTVTLTGGGYTSPAQALSGGSYTFSIAAGSLSMGSDILTVTYSGDSSYATKTATTSITVTGLTPAVAVTPSASTVAANTILTVAVAVTGAGTTPTGTVTLTGGGYTSPAQALSGGSYTFSIAAGSMTKGVDALTAAYSGDAIYAGQTGTASVTVTALAPTVTVTPSTTSMYPDAALTVTGSVSGSGATPTGTVTLSGGGYTGTPQTLSSGAYSITIPANSLSIGTATLSVSYSGDKIYDTGSNAASVVVKAGTFTLSATDVMLTAGAIGGSASTITVTPVGGYTGTVALTAAVTSSPAGSAATPTLTGGSVTLSGTTPGTGSVTIGTTPRAAIRAALIKGQRWYGAAGGAGMAALLLFFMPVGSRRWRKVLTGAFLLTLFSFAAVGCKGFWDPPTTTTTTQATATVTVTPAKNTIAVTDALSVSVTVTGTGSTPTGTVTLTSGSYTSAATSLSAGAATITIPASSLASGTDTLTVSYVGDTNYNTASGTATVIVGSTGTTAGAYTITVTGTGNDIAATTATTTFTLTVN